MKNKRTHTREKHAVVSFTDDATATATATVVGGAIIGVAINSPGTGYTGTPSVSFLDDNGAGAYAKAQVTNQAVTAISVLKGGHGYSDSTTVAISLDGGAALLTYAILTNPDPLQVPQYSGQTSRLTLDVSNSGSEIVNCASIVVTLPGPSQNAQDLTNSFVGIGVQVPLDQQTQQPTWQVSQSGGEFTLTPLTMAAGQIGAQGVYFIFDNIAVNDQPGTCSISIAEIASTSVQPCGTRSAPPILLNKWPEQFSISDPTATPTSVNYGNPTVIKWMVTGSNVTCELLYDPDGNGQLTVPVANVGQYVSNNLTNPNPVVFTLQVTATVSGQSQPMILQEQVTVSVVPQPTVEFWITANPIVTGTPLTFTLNWSLVDVESFQITADDNATRTPYTLPVPFASSGSYPVTPHRLQTNYQLQVLSTGSQLKKR
jgi:hypothetical protein